MAVQSGLYDSRFEHDACGVGFTVNIDGTKSHKIIEDGVQILCNLEHRGAVGGDMKTGDGAGMLLQMPDRFFRKSLNLELPEEGTYGVGMLFLPNNEHGLEKAQELVNLGVLQEGGEVLHWRGDYALLGLIFFRSKELKVRNWRESSIFFGKFWKSRLVPPAGMWKIFIYPPSLPER